METKVQLGGVLPATLDVYGVGGFLWRDPDKTGDMVINLRGVTSFAATCERYSDEAVDSRQ